MPSREKIAQDAIVGALTPKVYTMLDDADATGATVEDVRGGAYQWRASGTFDGASLSLDILEDDGETWTALDTLAAAGEKIVVVGQGSSVRVSVAAGEGEEPTGLFSSLRGVGQFSIPAA
jgi:hypothetical protein